MERTMIKLEQTESNGYNGEPFNLKNSKLIDIAFITKHQQFSEFLQLLADEYETWYRSNHTNINKKTLSDNKYHTKTLSINLIAANEELRYVSLSKNKNDYNNPDKKGNKNKLLGKEYVRNYVSYRTMLSVLDFFVESGYLTQYRGYYVRNDNNSIGKGLRTRIYPTPLFISKLVTYVPVNKAYSSITYDPNIIQLVSLTSKESNSTIFHNFIDNELTLKSRNLLNEYNGKLTETNIQYQPNTSPLSITKNALEEPIAVERVTEDFRPINRSYLKRVFTKRNDRQNFHCGGRYYAASVLGNSWQGITKSERSTLTINSKKTVELDYKSIHINLLYDLYLFNRIQSDPYEVYVDNINETLFDDELYVSDKIPRNISKLILLTAINAKNHKELLSSIRYEINYKDQKRTHRKYKGVKESKWFKDLDNTVREVIASNSEIAEFLNSDKGIELQRWDSDIATEVLEHFTRKGIVCLPVHDSFIVEEQYEKELKTVMEDAYKDVTGSWYAPKIDKK